MLFVHRVDRVAASEDARLFLGELRPLQIALAGSLLAVGLYLRRFLVLRQAIDQRVFRRDHHIGGAEERVGPRRVDAQALFEADLGADEE